MIQDLINQSMAVNKETSKVVATERVPKMDTIKKLAEIARDRPQKLKALKEIGKQECRRYHMWYAQGYR